MERRPNLTYTSLGWTPEQTQAFNDLKQALPDVAKQVVKARDTIFSASKHPPHEVLQSRNLLNAWLMMPSVFEAKPPKS